MRIARALALAGIDSRRKCEVHMKNGAVQVNGEVVRDLGRQVDLASDHITFRGRTVSFESYSYYLLHKPVGYTTTANDEQARANVYELLPKQLVAGTRQPGKGKTRVFPVGRLDRDSSGLLLFTNDGDLANVLTHPRYGVGKWYDIKLNRAFDPRDGKRIIAGVHLSDGHARAEDVRILSRRRLRVLMREGRKREVRRLLEAMGHQVVELCRVSFGPLMLGNLRPSQGRFLSRPEKKQLLLLKDQSLKSSAGVKI